MDKSAKILEYARNMGETANHAEKIGTTADGDVYGLSLLDAEGMPMPVGLPRLVIAKGEKYTLITGKEALNLSISFDLEE
ncbi:hypothetical protein D1647_24045 [Alistipes sp. Z76]|jgi:hypothetical protein|uniref:hypothetical protein n=2 Tax=uncultured Duncaniella sp. TaxID=2768039 RepID=UPI00136F76AA|nr:hypothetical protein [uncultured Duncaniella sp.]NBJ09205.1 hypothetical protein [Alistipes sp. Z76]NCE71208.1 hypothetical protein [Muribaculaceae bacterium M3]